MPTTAIHNSPMWRWRPGRPTLNAVNGALRGRTYTVWWESHYGAGWCCARNSSTIATA
jgi:hypothetical protein